MLDVFTNNFACLSQREVGWGGAERVLVGPRWAGPIERNQRVLQAPYDDVMLLARTLVHGDSDLPAARRVQQGFGVRPPGEPQPGAAEPALARSDDPGEDFVRLVSHALARNPLRSYETEQAGILARTGLTGGSCCGLAGRWTELLPGFLEALKEAGRRNQRPIDHWVYSAPAIGDFCTAYRLRAAVALGGLLALPAREVIYISTEVDVSDEPLHGANVYRLRLPAPDGPVRLAARAYHPRGDLLAGRFRLELVRRVDDFGG